MTHFNRFHAMLSISKKQLLQRAITILAFFLFGMGGWWAFTSTANLAISSLGGMLLGIAIWVGASCLVGYFAAPHLAEFVSTLFGATAKYSKPQPVYSIPEARRKEGRSQEAYEGFHAITLEHPQEINAYIAMIDVAIVDMRDTTLARTAFETGSAALRNTKDRDALRVMYDAILTRLKPEAPPPRRVITLRKTPDTPT